MEKLELTITSEGGYNDNVVTEKYKIGEEVSCKVSLPNNKEVESFIVNGVERKGEIVGNRYTFIITEETFIYLVYD